MTRATRRNAQQLDLYSQEPVPRPGRRPSFTRAARRAPPVCAGCRAKEARYGFEEEEGEERPRTLCFECFRLEIGARQEMSRQAAQRTLPLADTLDRLDRRRRRAQIAARRALGI